MSESGIFREGSLYYEAPDKKYDFLLIPETIEHVNNVELFLESTLKNADTHTEFLITAPNAFVMSQFDANNDVGDFYIETIHPDHNCWFSVYTLPNFIEKCYKNIGKKVVFSEIGFLAEQEYGLFYVYFGGFMKICILNIATNKYIQFVEQLLESVEENFLNGHDISALVFTDHEIEEVSDNVKISQIDHEPYQFLL